MSRVLLIRGSYLLAAAEFALGLAWMSRLDVSLRTVVTTAGFVVMFSWIASVVAAFGLAKRAGFRALLGAPIALFWWLLFGAAYGLCALGPRVACQVTAAGFAKYIITARAPKQTKIAGAVRRAWENRLTRVRQQWEGG